MNLFEQASRAKLRFPSTKGELTTEQLWDLPLTSRNGFDLDSVAKEVNRQLKDVSEDSFVAVKANPAKAAHELKLDLVKHIIAAKLADAEANSKAAERAAERARLTEILHQKDQQALREMSREDIQKRLDELSN